jgi:hypothetical protein
LVTAASGKRGKTLIPELAKALSLTGKGEG